MAEPGSLAGLRVATTRPVPVEGARDPLAAALERLGATVVSAPLTAIRGAEPKALLRVLREQPEWDWIVFTSATTVRMLFGEPTESDPEWSLARLGLRSTATRARVAAIGPSTAKALQAHDVAVSLVPPHYSQESLLEAFTSSGESLAGARILYPAAEDARDVLQVGLERSGATVTVVPVYRTERVPQAARELASRLERGELDLVAMLAPSAVATLAAEAPSMPVRVAVIGPVTADAARAAGMEVVAEAAESTAEGLVDAIARWWRTARG